LVGAHLEGRKRGPVASPNGRVLIFAAGLFTLPAMSPAAVKPLAKRRSCPICGKPIAAAHRPFCSARCADVDLSRWLGGRYRIATEEEPAMEELTEALRAEHGLESD